MNSEAQQYDVIVLGFDEESQETVHALQKKGKRALYIPIDPQMMLTLMSQKQLGVPISSPTTHINVHQNQLISSNNETITYFFQPEIKLDVQPNLESEIIENQEESLPLKANTEFEFHNHVEEQQDNENSDEQNKKEPESPEETEIGLSFPIITPLTKESSLIDNRLLGIGTYREKLSENGANGLSKSILSSYHLFNPIRIEEEEENEEDKEPIINIDQQKSDHEEDSQVTNESLFTETLQSEINTEQIIESNSVDESNLFFKPMEYPSNSDDLFNKTDESHSISQSLYVSNNLVEEETTNNASNNLDDSIATSSEHEMGQHDPNVSSIIEDSFLSLELDEEEPNESVSMLEETVNDTFEAEDELSDEVAEAQEETVTHQTLLLDRDIRLRKKYSFNNRHQGPKTASVEPLKLEKTKLQKTEEEPAKMPDVFPMEPFSSRRRNKKSRLFSSLENTLPNPIVQKPPTIPNPEMQFSSLIQDSVIDEENSHSAMSLHEQQEEPESLETSSDNLKIDTIEFEEPYGYNSFEDFFPSFSNSNDRKRQELDKIEKRKIALRGLHNLINNLG